MEHKNSEKKTALMASSNKENKTKQNLLESDSKNEAAYFSRFIVLESLENFCLSKFFPFLIEIVISTRATQKKKKIKEN